MTDENDDLEQTFKRINNPADLVNAIQNLIDNPNKVNYIPAHMRGNVRLGPDGHNHYYKCDVPRDVWSRVYIKARSCYLRLRGQGHKLPSLPETINPDPIVNLQIIQDKCLNIQEIKPPKPLKDKDAYIPFMKAIELSNGILNRRKLDKAIDKDVPVKVRQIVPRPHRKDVHIQDVLVLINKISQDEGANARAIELFSRWKEADIKKRPQPNLE